MNSSGNGSKEAPHLEKRSGMPTRPERVPQDVPPSEDFRALLKAVKTCRSYQLCLGNMLIGLEKEILRASEEQSKVAGFVKQSNRVLMVNRLLLDFPWFVDSASGEIAPPNYEGALLEEVQQMFPIDHEAQPWTKSELQDLKDALVHSSIVSLLDKDLSRASSENSSLLISDIFSRMISQDEPEIPSPDEIDWSLVSKYFVPSKPASECRRMWLSTIRGHINESEWTAEESQRLIFLVQTYGEHRWDSVAEALGTQRTPFQCVQRFQQSHNPNLLKHEFTPEEDERLVELVKQFGPNWDEISNWMDGRISSQINHRYNNTSVGVKHGNWSAEEDLRLIFGKKVYENWTDIAESMPQRTGVKCRERYVNVLDPFNVQKKNMKWTLDEDDLLKQLVSIHGAGKWSLIAKEMEGRNDNQVYRRWRTNVASPEELEEYETRLAIERELSINNFVGRKRHRPDLEVETFGKLVEVSPVKCRSTSRSRRGRSGSSSLVSDEEYTG